MNALAPKPTAYSIAEIATLIGAAPSQYANPDGPIEQLLLDSRHVVAPAYALFFALPGKRHDGHAHIAQAYAKGVRAFVVSRPIAPSTYPGADFLLVPDSLTALQTLAKQHRLRFPDLRVVGISGSNGKTIVKEWLWQLLSPDHSVVRSPNSYNSQVGVPLSLWQIAARHEIALIEAGISQPDEMSRLHDMIRPDIGLFTNLGTAHQEGFEDDLQKAVEKMRLFHGASALAYCSDYAVIEAAFEQYFADDLAAAPRRLTWSIHGKNALIHVESAQNGRGGSSIGLFPNPGCPAELLAAPVHFDIPFTDSASIENAVHCWVAARHLGCGTEALESRMAGLESVEMRLQWKAGIQQSSIIDDAYSNDVVSLRIGLQFARQQARDGKMTLVLSDILQSGQSPEQLWQEVAALLRAFLTAQDRLVAIGHGIRALQQIVPPEGRGNWSFFDSTSDFLGQVGQMDWREQVVLLKGARAFGFERIAARLEQKAHKTVLEVNLSAMVHNLNTYSRLLAPGIKMMAMVKAAGYGAGSAEVAKLLEFHKTDYLGVAYTDEGIELRRAGVQLPILVLNPEPTGFDAMFRYQLEPEVYSLALLDELARYAGTDRRMDLHLKLDTGMHRLGFEAADIPALTAALAQFPNLQVKSVFTHLSASDNPLHDDFTHEQARRFVEMYEAIAKHLGYRPLRHVCNSGGIARFPQYHFDMVRLGIGLYGIDGGSLQRELRVVNTLKATISQIKTVPPGDTVGYNRNSGILAQEKRIATISIGYADGLLRLAGGGRYSVGLHGQLASTVGNVCMDMTMIDVGHIPQAQVGDEVVVFGEYPTVQQLAECLQSIPYEVFTNVSERVKRIYWQG